jgi:hypothetical protein
VDTTHVHAFGQLAATGPLDVGQLIGILLCFAIGREPE